MRNNSYNSKVNCLKTINKEHRLEICLQRDNSAQVREDRGTV